MDGEDIVGLYDRHARQLLGFFMRRTRDPQLALDLLGETFLAVFENRARSRGPRDEERAAWLFRIAADKLAGHFRAGRSERRAITLRVIDEQPYPSVAAGLSVSEPAARRGSAEA
jgi:DNA-directed RNA polymerase specialized sigma24 family protein